MPVKEGGGRGDPLSAILKDVYFLNKKKMQNVLLHNNMYFGRIYIVFRIFLSNSYILNHSIESVHTSKIIKKKKKKNYEKPSDLGIQFVLVPFFLLLNLNLPNLVNI